MFLVLFGLSPKFALMRKHDATIVSCLILYCGVYSIKLYMFWNLLWFAILILRSGFQFAYQEFMIQYNLHGPFLVAVDVAHELF